MMSFHDQLLLKYGDYEARGLKLFAVTLSSYVQSDEFARFGEMRYFWDQHFMHRVIKRLPYKLRSKVDHDFVIESPSKEGGGYHFHGLLAFTPAGAERVWSNGELHKQLARDLDSFRDAGKYRYFRINRYEFVPIRSNMLGNWISYITKELDSPTSSFH